MPTEPTEESPDLSSEVRNLYEETILKPESPLAIKGLGPLEFSGCVQASSIIGKTSAEQRQASKALIEVSRELYENLNSKPFVECIPYKE
jgi:hypothetical protein